MIINFLRAKILDLEEKARKQKEKPKYFIQTRFITVDIWRLTLILAWMLGFCLWICLLIRKKFKK